MNSFNFDSHSKTSAFKKFKQLSRKYYCRFSKICKINVHLGLCAELKTFFEH